MHAPIETALVQSADCARFPDCMEHIQPAIYTSVLSLYSATEPTINLGRVPPTTIFVCQCQRIAVLQSGYLSSLLQSWFTTALSSESTLMLYPIVSEAASDEENFDLIQLFKEHLPHDKVCGFGVMPELRLSHCRTTSLSCLALPRYCSLYVCSSPSQRPSVFSIY